jgi:cytidylate kinase
VVLDGRDIGSVVFPNADVKFYLDAAPEKRAQRRFDERLGQEASFEAILEDIRARDHQDMTRADSPLARTPDAIYVDTTEMSPSEVITRLATQVQSRIGVISQP